MAAIPQDNTEEYIMLGLEGRREAVLKSATKLMHELGLALSPEYSLETKSRAPRSINQVVKNFARNRVFERIYAQDKAGIPITLGHLKNWGITGSYRGLCKLGGRCFADLQNETYSLKDIGDLGRADFLENTDGYPKGPFHEGAIKRIIIARIILDATDRFRNVCEYAPESPRGRKMGQFHQPVIGA